MGWPRGPLQQPGTPPLPSRLPLLYLGSPSAWKAAAQGWLWVWGLKQGGEGPTPKSPGRTGDRVLAAERRAPFGISFSMQQGSRKHLCKVRSGDPQHPWTHGFPHEATGLGVIHLCVPGAQAKAEDRRHERTEVHGGGRLLGSRRSRGPSCPPAAGRQTCRVRTVTPRPRSREPLFQEPSSPPTFL